MREFFSIIGEKVLVALIESGLLLIAISFVLGMAFGSLLLINWIWIGFVPSHPIISVIIAIFMFLFSATIISSILDEVY